MKRALTIVVYFDLICPWCLIGRRHLREALARFARLRPEVAVRVDWRSLPLLPDTPLDGLPYQSFYEQRLGGREAVAARRAQVQEAARAAGIEFAFDRIRVLPNTLAAHRLIGCAEHHATQRECLIDALFTAYFLGGEDIGDFPVLSRIAAGCGVAEDTMARCLAPAEAGQRFPERQAAPWRGHVSGVPFYVFSDRLVVSGAQKPEALLKAMQQASSPGNARDLVQTA